MIMETNPNRKDQNTDTRNSTDPRERLQQNPALDSEETRRNTSHGDKNDLMNEDPDEERRAIERSSEDNLEEAE